MGLGQHWLSVLFALSLLLAFGLVFNAIQANLIATVLESTYSVPTWVSGLGVASLTALVIFAA